MGRYLVIFLLFGFLSMSGQKTDKEKYVFVKKISEAIELDGKLEESFWSDLNPASQFIQYFPNDTTPATSQTELYLSLIHI